MTSCTIKWTIGEWLARILKPLEQCGVAVANGERGELKHEPPYSALSETHSVPCAGRGERGGRRLGSVERPVGYSIGRRQRALALVSAVSGLDRQS